MTVRTGVLACIAVVLLTAGIVMAATKTQSDISELKTIVVTHESSYDDLTKAFESIVISVSAPDTLALTPLSLEQEQLRLDVNALQGGMTTLDSDLKQTNLTVRGLINDTKIVLDKPYVVSREEVCVMGSVIIEGVTEIGTAPQVVICGRILVGEDRNIQVAPRAEDMPN